MKRSYWNTHRCSIVFKTVVVCFVSLFFLLHSPLSVAAHPATQLSPSNSTEPCVSGGNVTCIGMQFEYAIRGCTLDEDVFHATDDHGVPIDWTYSKDNHFCIGVYYDVPATSTYCDFYFYVPAGHATATVVFGYGTNSYASLNESNQSGWTYAFSGSSVDWVNFQDNNGQAVGSTQIGWANAKTTSYGFKRIC